MSIQRSIAGLAIIATVLAACSAAGSSPAASAPAASAATAGGATVSAVDTASFGSILAGPSGLTLYTYGSDSAGTSACTGGCATAWPPLTVPAGQQPTAGAGVTGTLATLTRDDGTIQVAYDGMPLYYWKSDSKPGDVTGDGVNGFSVAKAAGGAPAPGAPSTVPSASSGGKPGY